MREPAQSNEPIAAVTSLRIQIAPQTNPIAPNIGADKGPSTPQIDSLANRSAALRMTREFARRRSWPATAG